MQTTIIGGVHRVGRSLASVISELSHAMRPEPLEAQFRLNSVWTGA